MIFLKLVTLGSVGILAFVIDDKTGVGLGTLCTILVGWGWFNRKFQLFVDKFSALDSFVEESKRWRNIVSDEQALAKEEREQILRHQEQARQRHEIILRDMGEIKLARELYAELIKRMDEMRREAGKPKMEGDTAFLKKAAALAMEKP